MDLSPGWRPYLPLKLLDQLGTKRLSSCHALRFVYCIYMHLHASTRDSFVDHGRSWLAWTCAILKIRLVNSTRQSIAYRLISIDGLILVPGGAFRWLSSLGLCIPDPALNRNGFSGCTCALDPTSDIDWYCAIRNFICSHPLKCKDLDHARQACALPWTNGYRQESSCPVACYTTTLLWDNPHIEYRYRMM